MEKEKIDLENEVGIKDLYQHLSAGQLKEAEDNLNCYLEVCSQIFEENENEAKELMKRLRNFRKIKMLP